jgi:hypothetical protein
MAESKNTLNLRYPGDVFNQISDYALAAKLLNRPLWVYTRVDTVIAPDFYDIVHSTGGNVIPYFTYPGYVDPVDEAAQKTAIASGAIIIGWAWMQRRSKQPRLVPVKPSEPTDTRARKMTHAEDFVGKAKDRLQAKIDAEDEWNDL